MPDARRRARDWLSRRDSGCARLQSRGDDDEPTDKQHTLDYSRIATLLEEASDDGDAYDVLRGVLQMLNEQNGEKRGPSH